MASALPNPNDCCSCADGTAISTTTLDAYILAQVKGSAAVGIYAVASLSDLRAILTSSTNRYAVVFGSTPTDFTNWKWNNTGTNADDGVDYVRPNDYTTAGVWERATEVSIEIS
jgi:hypothetical protein